MKKVAIITIYGETNFGNRLQNYAVHRYLTNMGLACETLVFRQKRSCGQAVKEAVKWVLCRTVIRHNERNRVQRFSAFTRRYIPTRKIAPGYARPKLAEQYDYFVVGSDQVWNPCFGDFASLYDTMFLTFVPPEKRVCFSASFGVSAIPDDWKGRFATALSSFDKISVREEDGVQIVKDLTGKDAACLIDPTMLFDGEEWGALARAPQEKDYVFAYFLGECPPDVLPSDKKVIDVLDKASGNYFRYTPADFLGLIQNAAAVYTDSFHACVFSILFDKPFCVAERKDGYTSMSSRIRSLFSMFGIRYDFRAPCLVRVDGETRDRVLREKREEVRRFLREQIDAGDMA